MADLDELDRLHAAATAGEWVVSHDRNAQPNLYSRDADGFEHWLAILPHQCLVSLEVLANANAASIVAMHNAWPAISARLRAAEAELERLRGALRNVRDGYDCDEDAHKYGTICRRCDARASHWGSREAL